MKHTAWLAALVIAQGCSPSAPDAPPAPSPPAPPAPPAWSLVAAGERAFLLNGQTGQAWVSCSAEGSNLEAAWCETKQQASVSVDELLPDGTLRLSDGRVIEPKKKPARAKIRHTLSSGKVIELETDDPRVLADVAAAAVAKAPLRRPAVALAPAFASKPAPSDAPAPTAAPTSGPTGGEPGASAPSAPAAPPKPTGPAVRKPSTSVKATCTSWTPAPLMGADYYVCNTADGDIVYRRFAKPP